MTTTTLPPTPDPALVQRVCDLTERLPDITYGEMRAIVRLLVEAAALGAEWERRECAAVCDRLLVQPVPGATGNWKDNYRAAGFTEGAGECAEAIRARGAGGGGQDEPGREVEERIP